MPLNKDFIGREFPATPPFEVTAESVKEFADAVGDPNPAYRGEGAIAPPTYLTKLNFIYGPQVLGDPELGLNYMMVVHGTQEYRFNRPVRVGDVLIAKPKIGDIYAKGRNEFMITEAAIETPDGEEIAVAISTIVSRGTAPQEG
jgi:acyl dehydratase